MPTALPDVAAAPEAAELAAALRADPWHRKADRHAEHATLLAAVAAADRRDDDRYAELAGLAREFFDRWSAGYGERMVAWGYDMPTRIAAMLLKHRDADVSRGVLDAGAGDGTSGVGLRAGGLDEGTRLTALDVSPGMLAVAEKSGCYDRRVSALVIP